MNVTSYIDFVINFQLKIKILKNVENWMHLFSRVK